MKDRCPFTQNSSVRPRRDVGSGFMSIHGRLRRMIRHNRKDVSLFSYQMFQPFDTLFSIVSTRLGGVSKSPYHTLNLGLSVGDVEQDVIKNRAILCEALDIELRTVTLGQLVHGTHIEIVSSINAGKGALNRETSLPETDGLITNISGLPLLLLVADCFALSFFDPKRKVIGLGHAGWRGAVAGMPQKMIATMQKEFQCDPADILVGASPSIGPCCYEVREDVVQAFQEAYPDVAHTFFAQQVEGSLHLDMWTAMRWFLQSAGIVPEHLEMAEICTACHTDLFYSHRAEQGKTGRFGGMIMLRP